MTSSRAGLEIAVKQIEFARLYTGSLIADIADDEWFRMPANGVTHVAWQVAHLAMAQYGLCLFRIRGRRPDDLRLMSSDFRKRFSKGSAPNPDPAENPSPEEIRGVLATIHQQVLGELAAYVDEDLAAPVDEPHAVFATKLGALYFCSAHEMMHAGQIGLLRRFLGKTPIR
jgi:hypothetical protein